jgi:hypothetical protein
MISKSDVASAGRWLKNEAAEWVIGSWAMILGWLIVGVIFASFLQMDGYFSRGLGENSGVDPDLFMHIGWMFRLFAALFLVFTVKLKSLGMHSEAAWIKMIGIVVTLLVVAHALGFGLKALEGKRSNAVAVEQTANVAAKSNDQVIAELKEQKKGIQETRDNQLANLQSSIEKITGDGLDNDYLADEYRKDQKIERDNARDAIAEIDKRITDLTVSGGAAQTEATQEIATTEKWAPLFVGIAQLFTWDPNPDDWWIYVAGVLFIAFWIMVGDTICIFMPHALYKMHLADARKRTAQENGSRGGRTTARRRFIEDLRKVKNETRADLSEDKTNGNRNSPSPPAG